MKEQVLFVDIEPKPSVAIRVIDDKDTQANKESKVKYPFELCGTIKVTIITDYREFSFYIYNGYCWNGADIPKFFYRVIGSRTSNEFLVASLLHDFMLEFKQYIITEIFNNLITVDEYRRLTSLVFREKLKAQGTNVIKANIMAWAVDVFQHYFNKKGWQLGN